MIEKIHNEAYANNGVKYIYKWSFDFPDSSHHHVLYLMMQIHKNPDAELIESWYIEFWSDNNSLQRLTLITYAQNHSEASYLIRRNLSNKFLLWELALSPFHVFPETRFRPGAPLIYCRWIHILCHTWSDNMIHTIHSDETWLDTWQVAPLFRYRIVL